MKRLLVIFSFSLWLVLLGCQKELALKEAPAVFFKDTILTDTSIFFDAVIDGQREFHISLKDGYAHFWSSGVSNDDNAFGNYEQGIESNNGNSSLVFLRGAIRLDNTDTTFALKKQRKIEGFSKGAYNYTTNPNTNSGVILHWRDRNGKLWGTDLGPGVQTGSKFIITEILTTPANPASADLIIGIGVYAIYNCLLYDNAGHSIAVTNGRMRMAVWL